MKQYICRFFEEIFPLFPYLKSQRKILSKINNDSELAEKSKKYNELDADCLNERIKEEHERAVKIDDKTSKFTLGLSVSLTVLAAASGSLVKFIPTSSYSSAISIVCGIASIYMLLAGITALGALKTLATYGYGTEHLLKLKSDGVSHLSQALYAQERMNIVRQLRNEAAYQSLRNGFIMLFAALVISVVVLSNHQIDSMLKSNNTDLSNKSPVKNVLDKRKLISCFKGDNKLIQPTANTTAD